MNDFTSTGEKANSQVLSQDDIRVNFAINSNNTETCGEK